MTLYGVRGMQLGTTSELAWASVELGWIRASDREPDEILSRAQALSGGDGHFLNLGLSRFTPSLVQQELYPMWIWNHGNNIRALLTPGMSRRVFVGLMPPEPDEYPAQVWVKAPGHRGRGKYKELITRPVALPDDWDVQIHVEGQEFRVITVGHRCVQSSERFGDNSQRNYKWVGLKGTPMEVKDLARQAASLLDGHNVIGWDIIFDGVNAYLLEGNTCPGMNAATAERVVKEMERQREESNA